MNRPRASLLPLLALLLACGEPGPASPNDEAAVTPSRPTMVFPSSRDLEQLRALPPPADAFAVDSLPVDDRLPSATLHVLPGGDHGMAENRPDQIAGLIGRFLRA